MPNAVWIASLPKDFLGLFQCVDELFEVIVSLELEHLNAISLTPVHLLLEQIENHSIFEIFFDMSLHLEALVCEKNLQHFIVGKVAIE